MAARLTPTQPRQRLFIKALNRAIAQDDSNRLRAAAERLLDLAAAGEAWAVRELADRLDGKPMQETVVEVIDQRAQEMPDADLYRIAAGGSAGASEAQDSAAEPPRVH